MNTRAKVLLLIGGTLFLLLFQLLFWQDVFVGWFLFAIYLWSTGLLWRSFLSRIYTIAPRSLLARVLGPAISWFALISFGSVAVVWYSLTPLITWFTYVVTALLSVLFSYIEKGHRTTADRYAPKLQMRWQLFRCQPALFLVFFIVAFALLVLLVQSGSEEVLWSPWQSLQPVILPLYLILTGILGILVFSKSKTSGILALLMVHSLLLHAYLPFSHSLPWGGDVWRHIAAEQQLVTGEGIPPVLFGGEVTYRTIYSVEVPEALIIPHKYIYGHFWASAVLVAQTTGIDLLSFNIWYMPLLWGFLFPVLLFYFGKTLFASSQQGLILSYLGSLPFIFQALGAFTLPNSLGFLFFLLTLILWIRFVRSGRPRQAILPLFFALFSFFGYALYALLLCAIVFSTACIWFVRSKRKQRMLYVGSKAVLFGSGIFFFVLIDAYAGGSQLPSVVHIFASIKKAAAELSGYYFASQVWPIDITSGNILFNHIAEQSFIDNLFTTFRWHVFVLTVCFLFASLYGGIKLVASRSLVQQLMALLCCMVVGGYLIGWYIMTGDRLFVRRLDPLFALLILTCSLIALHDLVLFVKEREWLSRSATRMVVAVVLFFFSWSATTSYASGPDMRVLSQTEVDVAQYLLMETAQEEPVCMIADMWPLLAVEGLSAGQIVGGGFPITENFSQVERQLLYQEMQINPRVAVLDFAKTLTKSEQCRFAIERDLLSDELIALISELYDEEPSLIGSFVVWK